MDRKINPQDFSQIGEYFRKGWDEAKLVWALMREPKVPMMAKALFVGSLIYMVSPLDIIPDVIPIFGQLDDIAAVYLAYQALKELTPAAVLIDHKKKISDQRTQREDVNSKKRE